MAGIWRRTACALIVSWTLGCSASEEPTRVSVPIFLDGSGITTATTNLGYEVSWSTARIAVGDLQFTIAGEAHLAARTPGTRGPDWLDRVGQWLVPTAAAHPGHYEGGEVVGELLGRLIPDWVGHAEAELGTATLFEGEYTAVNFELLRATVDDQAIDGADDLLVGHTALLEGTATRDGVSHPFRILLDSPDGRLLVGAPCEVHIDRDTTVRLGFQFAPVDPLQGTHLLDDVDFSTLPTVDGRIEIVPDNAAVEDTYNPVRRRFQTHNHYQMTVETRASGTRPDQAPGSKAQ